VYSTITAIIIIGILEGSRARSVVSELKLSTDNYDWYVTWQDRIDELAKK
jgi:hypothetical protein